MYIYSVAVGLRNMSRINEAYYLVTTLINNMAAFLADLFGIRLAFLREAGFTAYLSGRYDRAVYYYYHYLAYSYVDYISNNDILHAANSARYVINNTHAEYTGKRYNAALLLIYCMTNFPNHIDQYTWNWITDRSELLNSIISTSNSQ